MTSTGAACGAANLPNPQHRHRARRSERLTDACVELYETQQSLEGIQGWLDLCFVKEAGVAGLLPGWLETAEHELRKTAEQGGRDVHPSLAC
jgi:hypothetical protein